MKSLQPQVSRRRFLLTASVATAATGAGVVSRDAARPPDQEAMTGTKMGYQVTEHVRNYYRAAGI